MRPAPPRHPLVTQMVAEVGGKANPRRDTAAIPLMYYSCWRLRWCGLLLLVSTTMQSVAVGGQLSGAPSCSAFTQAVSACVLLSTVLALWALLSQHGQSALLGSAQLAPCASSGRAWRL